MNNPSTITANEWSEIVALPRVREIWELEDTDTVEIFTSNVFGAKFHYGEKSPNEPGDLYIISSGNADVSNALIKRLDGDLFVEE